MKNRKKRMPLYKRIIFPKKYYSFILYLYYLLKHRKNEHHYSAYKYNDL